MCLFELKSGFQGVCLGILPVGVLSMGFCSVFPQAAELCSVHDLSAILKSNIVVKRNNCTSQIIV